MALLAQLLSCFSKNRLCFALLIILLVLLLLAARWAGITVRFTGVAMDDELQADQSLGEISASDINWVIAGDYWEKLTMGMNSFFDLATVAQQWNAAMSFPFTHNSFLFGLPADGRRKLDTIYDTQGLNRLMTQYNISPFTTFGHFLRSASRQVIAIEIKYGETQNSFGQHIYHSSCTKNTKMLIDRLNTEAHKQSAKQFIIKKCCYVLAAHGTSPHEISSLCGFNLLDRKTILIDQWRGYNDRRWFRVIMKNFLVSHPSPWTPLPYSKKVTKTSTVLLKKHLGESSNMKFVGVHLRSEKIKLRASNNVTIINQCFEKVYQLSHEIASNYSGIPVIYFGDGYSHAVFGKQLSKNNIAILQCNRNVPPKERNLAFDALVEQDMVSRAEVLIMLGGGSFQMQILSRYYTFPNAGLAYQVCDEARHDLNDYLRMTRT